MRPSRSALRLGLLAGLACLGLLLPPHARAKKPAPKAEAAAKAEPAPQGEPVEISGRIAVGLDKVFIKDAQGYCLVQGLDLSPYAGRQIKARGLLLRRDQEYRIVRLLEYSIQSPDDDSPSALRPAGGPTKKK